MTCGTDESEYALRVEASLQDFNVLLGDPKSQGVFRVADPPKLDINGNRARTGLQPVSSADPKKPSSLEGSL